MNLLKNDLSFIISCINFDTGLSVADLTPSLSVSVGRHIILTVAITSSFLFVVSTTTKFSSEADRRLTFSAG
jgi:hypothetical protein